MHQATSFIAEAEHPPRHKNRRFASHTEIIKICTCRHDTAFLRLYGAAWTAIKGGGALLRVWIRSAPRRHFAREKKEFAFVIDARNGVSPYELAPIAAKGGVRKDLYFKEHGYPGERREPVLRRGVPPEAIGTRLCYSLNNKKNRVLSERIDAIARSYRRACGTKTRREAIGNCNLVNVNLEMLT